MKLLIKNMVSLRCKMIVKSELEKMGLHFTIVELGEVEIREKISEKVKKLYNTDVHPADEITITPGGTYALYTALTAILQPGDEVIVFEPAYDCYIPQIELSGAVAVTIPLTAGNYKIDKALTRSKITAKTKAIMINSPHNPSGAVLEEDDIKAALIYAALKIGNTTILHAA